MEKISNPSMDNHCDILSFLQNNIRDFPFTAIVFKEGYEHIIAEVNKTWIFRFAKTTTVQKNMLKEIKLLEYLKNKIPHCSIPEVIYYFPDAYCFGYKKIKGETLSQKFYKSLSLAQQNRLAKHLAQFLYEFHSILSIKCAKNIGLVFADWPLSPKNLKNNIKKENNNQLSRIFEKFIKRYEYILDATPLIAIHNDIHEKNILVDSITKKLSGIIDFTSASIGTIYHAFRYLHLIDQNFLVKVVEAYSQKSNHSISLQNVYILCLATEFSRLTEKSPLSQDYGQIIQRIYELDHLL